MAGQVQRIKDYIKKIYGKGHSEKLDPSQMVFDDVILAAEKYGAPDREAVNPEIVEEKVQAHIRRRHSGRKPLPPELERIEHYLDIPKEDKFTVDGKERPLIGLDITERLDYQACSFVVHRYVRPKYGADDNIEGSGIKQHPPVDVPIYKCSAESGLLAHIITEKYEHHTPLYRQEQKYSQHNIDISRKTMAGWMGQCAQVLKPLYDQMHQEILKYDIVFNDDTPVEMLDPGSGTTKTTRMWCTVGGEDQKYCMYNFILSRGREGPLKFFKDYNGYFMSDAFASYEPLFKKEDVNSLSCWAHARRYFKEVQDSSPKAATEMLTRIAQIYKIDKKIKHFDDKRKLHVRRKESRSKLAKILLWLRKNKHTHLPKSPMYKAIHYFLNIRRRLTRYTTDGRLLIDNTLAENGIRPIALGRKNWMFVGSENGGHTAATLMTFCMTCRKLKINSWVYLKDVLQRINSHPMSKIDELLPHRWQEIQNQS
ncbi:MAG: transposase [Candidatus Omnitrophota bacterium]|jgi:transposase